MPDGTQQLLTRWFGFRAFGFLLSFVIRHSDFGQTTVGRLLRVWWQRKHPRESQAWRTFALL